MRNQTGTDDILVARLIIYRSKPVDTQTSHHVKVTPTPNQRNIVPERQPRDGYRWTTSECALNRSALSPVEGEAITNFRWNSIQANSGDRRVVRLAFSESVANQIFTHVKPSGVLVEDAVSCGYTNYCNPLHN
jgi:hypothetical protein